MEINEFNQEKLRLLDTEQLLAFYGIFGTLSSPKAEAMVKGIARELKRRKYTLGEENLNEVDVKSLLKGLAKSTRVAGKTLKTAIKVGYPIARDMVKATWMTAKKIGGAIGNLMDDPEFRKLFTKYVDNPEDPNRLKKVQAYADGMLSDAPVSGMESVQMKKLRIEKVCSIILGENFCPDFIYEDVDFTKPSAIKEAYEVFEANGDWVIYNKKTGKRLSPSKSWRKWQGAKAAASKIGGDAEVADTAWYQDNKAKLMGEATDKELDIKSLKDLIKNPSPKMIKQYGGKDKYIKMLKSKLAKLNENRAIVYNPRMIKAFIKQAEKKFPKYKGEIQQIEKDEIVFPNDEKLRDFFRGAKEVKFVLRDSVELEEAIKWWTVTITKKTGKLFKGQTVDVKASNSAQAIKKGLKQMKANPALVPSGSVDAVLGESTK